ncbi:YidC/Oxa1 family membrane protein insertase [Fusibacter tunisiensis]|uniref:YidC/Oxa1 family membrane protein insertase n=1 Tax=Fusibacter tunisiensis TaxID=1008308 RepID=A0ABS2MNL8_9FIRM|nr:YidC/Oxa1 family membrane protein insertase [Fusibacter tunisiensis]MBM7561001.1 YidC/Oxa1 family membrane protein insertase [Fusibacter tunisiensis]
MSIFADVFGYLLGLIYGLVKDYGVAIIIFTLLTKLILMPFTIKQLRSSKEMAAIQPKMQEIQEKYKDNKEVQSQKMLELYKEHNYNPLSGCLPLLIQFPIIIGLFTALREPATYVFANNPELLETATHQTFLWMKNLSQPDLMSNIFSSGPAWLMKMPGLMPILSAVLTYFQMSSMNAAQGAAATQNNSLKMMQTIFPLMILFWGTSLSAGLILYWTVGSIFQIGQQYYMKRPVKGENV